MGRYNRRETRSLSKDIAKILYEYDRLKYKDSWTKKLFENTNINSDTKLVMWVHFQEWIENNGNVVFQNDDGSEYQFPEWVWSNPERIGEDEDS